MVRTLFTATETRGKLGSFREIQPLISNDLGKASTTILGTVVFVLGIGLTLFVIVNPMKVGLFEKVKNIIMPRAETGAPAADTGERKVKYWHCAMHPTYISDEPGTCGICNMDLIPVYEDESGGEKSGERKVKYWRAPMDPTYISDTPGKSPMGMDLIPVYEDEVEEASATAIRIDPATVQNIGVISETIKRGDLRVGVRTVGTLDYDEDKIFWINTKYDGWIEKVYVDYIGEQVQRGEPLFEIYSPDLVSTQEEYLSALKYRDEMAGSGFPDAEARANNLLAASRRRLLYWDITDEQIRRLEEQGQITKTLTVASPATGTVVGKMDQALEGMYAKAGMNLYKIADLSGLWVHVDIYEYQLPWIKVGQEAKVELTYYPGDVFRGKVLFFYPYLDKKTRTIRVCIEIPNTDRKLRPDMFATVTFAPVAAKDAILVPEMAVLHSGERDVVVLDLGGGRFEPRDVKLGLQGEGMYQVLEGLESGEKIVTSAQFLIDSESNLREAINKMLMAKKGEVTADVPSEPVEHEPGMEGMERGSGTKEMEHGSETKGVAHSESQTKPVIEDTDTIEALGKILEAYLPIWRALAENSTAGIEERARELARAADVASGRVEQEMLRGQLEALEKAASEMKTSDLEAARESMKGVSRALVAIFESHEVRMPTRYTIIWCPMVDEKWIQDTQQVSNPFFGSSMLRCGTQVGEIG